MASLGIEKEKEAFLKLKPNLLGTHRGQYVAVLGGELVDSDYDGSALATRVYKKHGNVEIYIDEVTEEKRVIHIRTPFRVKDRK